MAKGATSKKKREDENRQNTQQREETRQRQQRTQRETSQNNSASSRQTTRRDVAPAAIPVLEERSTPRMSASGRNVASMFPESTAPQTTNIPKVEPIQTNNNGQGFASDVDSRVQRRNEQGIRLDAEERIKASDASQYGTERAEEPQMEEYPSTAEKGRKNAQRRSDRDAQNITMPSGKNGDYQGEGGGRSFEKESNPEKENNLSDIGQQTVDDINKKIDRLSVIPTGTLGAVDQKMSELYDEADTIRALDNLSTNEKMDYLLDPEHRMSKSEQDYAKSLFDEYLENNPKVKDIIQTNNPNAARMMFEELSPEEQREYERMTALSNKTSNIAAFASGLISKVPFARKGFDKAGEILGVSDDSNFTSQLENERKQSPVAELGGEFSTIAAEYSALQPALERIPALASATNGIGAALTGGNEVLGNAIGSVLRGTVADAIIDTAPNVIVPGLQNGDSLGKITLDTAKNLAINTLFNAGAEAIPYLFRGARQATDNVDEVVDAARQSDMDPADLARQNEIDANARVDEVNQAVDEINRLDEQMPNVPERTNDVNAIDNDVRNLLREYYHSEDIINDTSNPDTLRTHLRRSAEIETELKQRAPELFNEYGDLKDIPRNLIYGEPTETIKQGSEAINIAEQIPEVPAETTTALKQSDEIIQPEPAKSELEREAEAFFSDMREGYDGSRDWWKNTIDRAKEFAYNGDPAETAARADIASRYLGQMEQLERESKALIDAGGTPTWSMPSPTKQLDNVVARINGVLDNVSLADEKVALEADNIRKAIDNYRTALEGDSLDAITQARKDLTNAAKRFDTRAKKIDLEGYDGTFGNRSFTYNIAESTGVGSPETLWKNIADAEERNRILLSGGEQEDTLGKLLNGEPLDEPVKAVPAAENPKVEPIPVESAEKPIDTDEPIDLTRNPSGKEKERGTSEHIRSIEDVRVVTPMKMEGVSDEVISDFIDNPDMYKVLKNADTKALADDIYNSGDQAVRIGDKVYTGDIDTKFGKLLSEKNPAALPLGHQLAKDYSAAGNHDMAAQIYRRMGEELTKAGQFSQAAAINMMKNDPLTALQYAERQLDAINEQGLKRFRDRWVDLSLTDDEIKAFNDIKPGDSEAIKALYDKIGARLGKEYPSTFMDKLLEGRKVAMLFNVRTNVRNLSANAPTLGMRWVSDRFDALGQNIAHIINPDFKVTQAGFGNNKQSRSLAKQVYESDMVQALLNNDTGKYEIPELSNALMKDRQVFKGTALSKWINRVTDGGIEELNKELFGKEGVESTLETIRNATYKALELGDTPFVKENFIERLGSYINAQGIKDIKDVPDDAIQLAWEEAMKATYKDNSWAVQMLRGFKNGMEKIPVIGRPLSQASIPFLQAPGNIAARMVDYSPIRGMKGIGDIISGAKNNSEQAVRRGIEEVSKGITGTGMVILGMKLKKAGILTGDYSKDKDQKNFEKQNGFKPWALHVGNKYFTYDWAQPFAQPMIIGTLLQEAIDNSDEYDSTLLNSLGIYDSKAGDYIGAAKAGAKASINSWFDASPLQGMADLLKSDYSGETDVAQNVFDTAVSDFAGAFVPAIVNATAKTIDPTQRNTDDPSNPLKTFINSQQAKLPGLSAFLPEKYDTWGEQMNYADNSGEAFLQRFLIPGDYATESDDPIDVEINNLFDSTGDNGVFPLTAANKVGDRKLNNREVSDYQQDMGQRSRQFAETFINSDLYQNMDATNRAATLKTLYAVSRAITERDLFDKPVAESSVYKKYVEAYDAGNVEGLFNAIQGQDIVNSTNVSSSSKAATTIKDMAANGDIEGAERLSQGIDVLAQSGVSTEAQGVYADRSINYLGNIDPTEYSNTWNAINTGGGATISQGEMLDYFKENESDFKNNGAYDLGTMFEYWGGYVTRFDPEKNQVPYIKDDGTIGTHKLSEASAEDQKLFESILKDNSQASYGEATISSQIKNQEGQGFAQNAGQPKPVETNSEETSSGGFGDWLSDALSGRDREEIPQVGNSSADPVQQITSSGVAVNYPDEAWAKASTANPNITPQEFTSTWSAIDANHNGAHSTAELINYLNRMGYTPENAEELLNAYWHNNWHDPRYNGEKWSY